LLLLFLLVFSLQAAPSPHADIHLELGPMLGHVGPTEARLWFKANGPAQAFIIVGETENLEQSKEFSAPKLLAETDFMAHVMVHNLKPGTRYFYNLILDGKPSFRPPLPSFVTAPRAGMSGHLRFVFGSCVGHFGFEAAPTWNDMVARTNFDLLLMLGDNHYADSTNPLRQRSAYYMHRRVPAFQEIGRRTPVYGIWDDHDFARNDSDGTTKGKEVVLQTFKEFWPNPAFGETNNPGVYFKFTRGDVDFFMLDGRYYRSPDRAHNDSRKTMLGAAQLAWLRRELAASTATVKFIASGGEWQTHSHLDSWASFDHERREIWKFIGDNHMAGVILLSGDRHFTAGYQVQKRFIEVTSGPLGSMNARVRVTPEMFTGHGAGKMYSLFDVDTSAAPPVISLEIYRVGHGLLEQRTFSWDEVNGRKSIKPITNLAAKTDS